MKHKETGQPTFLFHDYETFGQHPALDRVAQFAAIRTDSDFNIIGDPEVFYCKPADDYLPQAEAVLITGITPQKALREGLNEAEFTQRIHTLFTVPATCILGYNNIRFDDEVSRNLFYRNFYDPYAWSWQQGNSRWDLIDVLRACYALRPNGINWPENADGLPSFKLEHLTTANQVDHLQAHDAMSDVYATIAMAKLVKQQQPKLFNYLFIHRNKNKLTQLINIPDMTPLTHVSGMFGALRGNLSLVAPLAWHPQNKNAVIMVDLAGDMQGLLQESSESLRARLYTKRDKLKDESPVPLKLLHINKCPVLAPATTLRPEDAERLAIDLKQCVANLALLRAAPIVREKALTIFSEPPPFATISDVDAMLYHDFFSDADKQAMAIIRNTAAQHLPALDLTFSDKRLAPLLFRYRARNFPTTLDAFEQQRWLEHRRLQLNESKVMDYFNHLAELAQLNADDANKITLLQELDNYARNLLS